MKTSYFELRHLSAPYRQYNYSVSWPGQGSVYKNRDLLIRWAFETGANQIAFSGSDGKVLHVGATVFYTQRISDIVDLVMQDMPYVTAVAFEQRDQAEKFIESAEKHIMWKLLKRKQET